MNITEAQEQLVNIFPIVVTITMVVGFIVSFFGFRKKKEEGSEVGLKLDPLDAKIQEIYKLQKKHKKG